MELAALIVDLGVLEGQNQLQAPPFHFPEEHYFVRRTSSSSSCTRRAVSRSSRELAIGFEPERVHLFYWSDAGEPITPSNACALHTTDVTRRGSHRHIKFGSTGPCRFVLNVPETFELRCRAVAAETAELLRCELDDSTDFLRKFAHPEHGELELGRPGVQINISRSGIRRPRTWVSQTDTFTGRLASRINRYVLPPRIGADFADRL